MSSWRRLAATSAATPAPSTAGIAPVCAGGWDVELFAAPLVVADVDGLAVVVSDSAGCVRIVVALGSLAASSAFTASRATHAKAAAAACMSGLNLYTVSPVRNRCLLQSMLGTSPIAWTVRAQLRPTPCGVGLNY